eukprot:Cvel_34050.t1-p1 / transcript=Cvel_34050.t1 / gene=Cvel_34050 / organism=Chromera_velia_CCMP2878 / gene_product=hypothetical protein / transcript_product=hypothetical protein / location=Cvel_scaffold5721:307-740(-) / protein_length=54 / sequence_SO=supercontig / SO=protein_coding / is_pseudo=false
MADFVQTATAAAEDLMNRVLAKDPAALLMLASAGAAAVLAIYFVCQRRGKGGKK